MLVFFMVYLNLKFDFIIISKHTKAGNSGSE